MSTRWLTGFVLFALGCATSLLIRPVETLAAPAGSGVVEGNLKYINGDDFRLIYPNGRAEYLVVVKRKPGAASSEPLITTQAGLAVFSKRDFEKLTVYRIDPQVVVASDAGVIRCARGSDQCPVPPPPPEQIAATATPQPPPAAVTFFKSGPQTAAPPTQ